MRWTFLYIALMPLALFGQATGPFAPAAGQMGSTAIHKDSSLIEAWAQKGWLSQRGWLNIADTSLGLTSHGDTSFAFGPADGQVLSLGDSGVFTYYIPQGLPNQAGPEFAIFENSFSDVFLELAFVEVSKDGSNYQRFPASSLLDTTIQTGSFGPSDPSQVHNLAGKFRADYGVPFDLSEIGLDTLFYVRVIDVIGSIDPHFGSRDQQGRLINDPYPTAFASGGFDLDALAILKPNSLSADAPAAINRLAYPNPATSFVIVKEALHLCLYSLEGMRLAQIDGPRLGLQNINKGCYILETTYRSGERQLQKLLVE